MVGSQLQFAAPRQSRAYFQACQTLFGCLDLRMATLAKFSGALRCGVLAERRLTHADADKRSIVRSLRSLLLYSLAA